MSSHPPYGYPVLPVAGQVVVQPYRCSSAHVVIAWILAVLTAGYLLPWAIGATRNRSNVAAIALVNLFLGWSLVGWVVALVMACGSDRPLVVVQPAYVAQPVWGPPYQWPAAPPAPYPGPVPPPATSASAPPGPPALPPAPRRFEAEPTRIDPIGTEPTRPLPTTGWERPGPYDPPVYGPRNDDRR